MWRANVLTAVLQERFIQSSQYARILKRTVNHSLDQLNITGLTDSAKSLLLSLLIAEVKRPFFLLVSDNHQAGHYEQ